MSKLLGAAFLVTMLANGEAGFLETVGGRTEQLGQEVHKGTIQVEERLRDYFRTRHSQPEVPPEPPTSYLPTRTPPLAYREQSTPPEYDQPDLEQPKYPPAPPGVPEDYYEPIKIYGPEDASTPGLVTATRDQDVKDEVPVIFRTSIEGAHWCPPGETYEHGSCRDT